MIEDEVVMDTGVEGVNIEAVVSMGTDGREKECGRRTFASIVKTGRSDQADPALERRDVEEEYAPDQEESEDNEKIVIKKLPNGICNLVIGEIIKREIRKEWWDSLLVKLMGRRIFLQAMKRRLEIVWEKRGNFDLKNATIDRIVAWVRLPGLAIEYYNRTILEKISNIVGRTLKIELNTAEISRGKFARICVEIDLDKPLVSQYQVNEINHTIEYERLHQVCFECRRVGHENENCPEKKKDQVAMNQQERVQVVGGMVEEKDREIANQASIRTLKEIIRQKKPSIVLLYETRCSGSKAKEVVRDMGFRVSYREEAVVYACPQETLRKDLREKLFNLAQNMGRPWMLVGDFNDIDYEYEKKEGARVDTNACRRFQNWVNKCNLVDLGYVGSKFTWKGAQREGIERVFKRIDRALANTDWRRNFGDARVEVLLRVNSDHHPFLVRLKLERLDLGDKLFRFEIMWRTHPSFKDFLN
ncbi:hypothetical protein Ahy_A07g035787 [Arachis hypogaea]|uniref:CCHC-type domain-containing protein n=1 Tax=Arachis hypogaea TaxID=3818 RepID=A0A445CEJ2_ARAHY|nr:hypothetical protein Ahy_A07g035787 [Arachis hypogaea]